MAQPQSEDADGEFAGLLRAGRADRGAGDGRSACRRARKESAPPFPLEDLRRFFAGNGEALRRSRIRLTRRSRRRSIAWPRNWSSTIENLEELEQRLTALEDKMMAAARVSQTDEQLLAARRELDLQLRPYRGKMTAEQLTMLEKQYLERRLLERNNLPRLSLFYLR